MSTKTKNLPHCFIFCCLILIGLGFGQESDSEGIEELHIPSVLAQGSHTAQLHKPSEGVDVSHHPITERGIASMASVAPVAAMDPHDCEAARDAHIHDPITGTPLTDDEALELFLSLPRGQALMDEFLNTVETPEGERVLKIDIAQDFEQSLEHLDHTSASDSL